MSGGYSTVRVQRSEGYYTADQYKQGQYIFGNIFYSLTPRCKVARLRHGEDGQGTTEYAILVGVLVVIAIIAITVFRPKLQELWDAIADGINSL